MTTGLNRERLLKQIDAWMHEDKDIVLMLLRTKVVNKEVTTLQELVQERNLLNEKYNRHGNKA